MLAFGTATLMLSAQFKQAALPYTYDALEPYIDAKTMEIHYTKHHAAYVDNLNKAVAGKPEAKWSEIEMFSKISTLDPAIRNNAGGDFNHTLFWSVLTPKKNTKPSAALEKAIVAQFGSFDNFKKEFEAAATKRFGSGWAWLAVGKDGKIFITSTANQDNPLMDVAEQRGTPIFGIDVWEHAYYLKYQNKRPEYLTNIWNVVNWEEISKRYQDSTTAAK